VAAHPNIQNYALDNDIEWAQYPAPQKPHKINIENDVWIGDSVFINAGIKISNGAVIAANSSVVRDVGPYEIVGGNPAKLIKKRFSQEIIERFLPSEWWLYDPKDLKSLDFQHPMNFLDNFEAEKNSLDLINLEKISLIEMPVMHSEIVFNFNF
jgi:hypothetical protein